MSARTERDAVVGGPKGMMIVDDETNARVAKWRRQRMSWADIARNLGRAEPDVRRAFDTGAAG